MLRRSCRATSAGIEEEWEQLLTVRDVVMMELEGDARGEGHRQGVGGER